MSSRFWLHVLLSLIFSPPLIADTSGTVCFNIDVSEKNVQTPLVSERAIQKQLEASFAKAAVTVVPCSTYYCCSEDAKVEILVVNSKVGNRGDNHTLDLTMLYFEKVSGKFQQKWKGTQKRDDVSGEKVREAIQEMLSVVLGKLDRKGTKL